MDNTLTALQRWTIYSFSFLSVWDMFKYCVFRKNLDVIQNILEAESSIVFFFILLKVALEAWQV